MTIEYSPPILEARDGGDQTQIENERTWRKKALYEKKYLVQKKVGVLVK